MKTSLHTATHARLMLAAFLSLCAPLAAAAQETTNLVDLVKTGGWAMWPLGAASLLTCHLAVASLLELRAGRFLPRSGPEQLRDRIAGEGLEAVSRSLQHEPGPGAGLLCETARLAMEQGESPAASERIADGIARIELVHSGRLQQLGIIASVAPLVGLLGTVSGMIGAFQTISGGGMGKAELLAGDIGEALVTTAAGLIVGIPAMIACSLLRSKLQSNLARLSAMAQVILERTPQERSG